MFCRLFSLSDWVSSHPPFVTKSNPQSAECLDKNLPARLNATNHFPVLFISANIPKHQLAGPDKSLFGGWKSVS